MTKKETAEQETIKIAREKRLSITNTAPSAANGWTGVVTVTIVETGEQISFSFVTPELSESHGRAIVAGYAARLTIAASGKKTSNEIAKALADEIIVLTSGTYTVRGGGSIQSSFSDTIIAITMLRQAPEVTDLTARQEIYAALLQTPEALAATQAEWDATDETGKKAMVTSEVNKIKRLVSFFKL